MMPLVSRNFADPPCSDFPSHLSHLAYVVAFWEVVQKRGEEVEHEIAQRLLHDSNLHQLLMDLTSDSPAKRLFTGLRFYLGPYLIGIALMFVAYKLYF